jgi:copper chaperone CopZ
MAGVTESSVNLATGEARVSFETSRIARSDLLTAVEDIGYRIPVSVVEVSVQGMHCAACVSRVERVLGEVPGVLPG